MAWSSSLAWDSTETWPGHTGAAGDVTVVGSPVSLTTTAHAGTAVTSRTATILGVAATVTVIAVAGTVTATNAADTTVAGEPAGVTVAAQPGTVSAVRHVTVTGQAASVTLTAQPGTVLAGAGADATVAGPAVTFTVTAHGGLVSTEGTVAGDDTWPLVVGIDLDPANAYALNPPVPAPVTERELQRRSQTWAVPAHADGQITTPQWAAASEVVAAWGVLRVYVDGIDRTWFRDKPIAATWTGQEPFGDGPATLAIPQVLPFEQLGAGDLAWLRHGAKVDLWRYAGGALSSLWHGHVTSLEPRHDQRTGVLTVPLAGGLFQADLAKGRTPIRLDPVDVGQAIADALNGVVSRQYGTVAPTVTGIATKDRGSSEASPLGYATDLLATATTDDGTGQWTIARTAPRQYALQLKDRTTAHWTVVTGQPGLAVDLVSDLQDTVNVIYGRGIDDGGCRWANWRYPNLTLDDAPAYPNASAGNTITVGETDANTDSGTGVSTWEQRARDLGYNVPVDGVFSAADAQVLRQIQARYGIQVDGDLGPQSWAATFAVGSNAGSLDGAYRAPLAIDPRVEPHLYSAEGHIVGTNPAYDPAIMRVERDLNFGGGGISKGDGTRSALAILAREGDAGWVGRLTLAADPQEGSRLDIREGQNIRLLGWQTPAGILLHVARVDHDPGGTTTVTVDSKARDLLTVAQVIQRNKASLSDPARRPGSNRRSKTAVLDAVVEFDCESSAGRIPRHAVYRGLYNVLRVPVSQVGKISKVEYRMTSPPTRFWLGLFGDHITPADLVRILGSDPVADGNRNAKLEQEALDAHGYIEAWGGDGEAAGYWPGENAEGDPVTGVHIDTGGLDYTSARPPWVWVAEWSPVSTFAEGRLYPAAVI